jgi:hypothetical protein
MRSRLREWFNLARMRTLTDHFVRQIAQGIYRVTTGGVPGIHIEGSVWICFIATTPRHGLPLSRLSDTQGSVHTALAIHRLLLILQYHEALLLSPITLGRYIVRGASCPWMTGAMWSKGRVGRPQRRSHFGKATPFESLSLQGSGPSWMSRVQVVRSNIRLMKCVRTISNTRLITSSIT